MLLVLLVMVLLVVVLMLMPLLLLLLLLLLLPEVDEDVVATCDSRGVCLPAPCTAPVASR